LRQAIVDLGNKALQTGRPLGYNQKYRAAVDWMVEKGFASLNEKNELILLSSCMETTTFLKQPRVVDLPLENSSWFWLRKLLNQSGWSAGDGMAASVSNKIFNQKNGQKLYMEFLLTRHLDLDISHYNSTLFFDYGQSRRFLSF